MSHKFTEGDLLFEFDEQLWRPLESWDKHAAYRTGIREMDGGKAVDFIGVYRDRDIYFIEVKDYRIHEHRKEITPWNEFELKVRNTVAGLVGSGRREQYADVCAPFLNALFGRRKLKLVYWIELPPPSSAYPAIKRRRLAEAGFAARQTSRLVKWLDARAFSVSQEDDYEQVVPGLRVQNLPRKRGELAEGVVKVLQTRGVPVDEAARRRISEQHDLDELEMWRELAATVSTVKELFRDRR